MVAPVNIMRGPQHGWILDQRLIGLLSSKMNAEISNPYQIGRGLGFGGISFISQITAKYSIDKKKLSSLRTVY